MAASRCHAFSISLIFVINLCEHYTVSLDVGERTFKLNNGVSIPAVALGTSLGHDSEGRRVVPKNDELAKAVELAIQFGYRHIDTAALYRVEDQVGKGLANKVKDNTVKREDVFITTKLFNDQHKVEEVLPALRASLERLRLEQMDLYLVHWPMAYTADGNISQTDYLETWRGMEAALDLGLTRAIGVSNFNVSQLQRLLDNSRIKPAVLQIEVNPTLTQTDLVNFCKEHDILVMAYSPFGSIFPSRTKPDAPPPKADDAVLQNLAQKYGKTPAQIVLRYLLDRNLLAIPRSTNEERIHQNIDILDFKLLPEEVDQISSFNKDYRTRQHVRWFKHPLFPYETRPVTDAEKQFYILNPNYEE